MDKENKNEKTGFFTKHGDAVAVIGVQIATLAVFLTVMLSMISNIQTQISQVNSRQDAMNARIDAMNVRMDTIQIIIFDMLKEQNRQATQQNLPSSLRSKKPPQFSEETGTIFDMI